MPETCDGKDNDCDGKTDEGLQSYGTCSNAHPYECQSGFTTTGKKSCEDGDEVCKATVGADYCNGCNDLAFPQCGGCAGADCSVNSHCAPGSNCQYNSGFGKKVCTPIPDCVTDTGCWKPYQNGTCP